MALMRRSPALLLVVITWILTSNLVVPVDTVPVSRMRQKSYFKEIPYVFINSTTTPLPEIGIPVTEVPDDKNGFLGFAGFIKSMKELAVNTVSSVKEAIAAHKFSEEAKNRNVSTSESPKTATELEESYPSTPISLETTTKFYSRGKDPQPRLTSDDNRDVLAAVLHDLNSKKESNSKNQDTKAQAYDVCANVLIPSTCHSHGLGFSVMLEVVAFIVGGFVFMIFAGLLSVLLIRNVGRRRSRLAAERVGNEGSNQLRPLAKRSSTSLVIPSKVAEKHRSLNQPPSAPTSSALAPPLN